MVDNLCPCGSGKQSWWEHDARGIPQIAKTRRIGKAQEEFRARLLAKDRGEPRPPSRWPKRKMRKTEISRR
jgi:hypothetical protein